jgi:hypothetical protein
MPHLLALLLCYGVQQSAVVHKFQQTLTQARIHTDVKHSCSVVWGSNTWRMCCMMLSCR